MKKTSVIVRNLIIMLFLLNLTTNFSFAQNTAPIPVDESIRMGVLSNGLHYYIKKNSKPENRAELRLAVHAGAVQEDDNQLGLAHFVEHMAFNGSKHFKKNELVDYLESVGTKFGPDLNAYTSFDETVYMLQVRTDEEELLDKGLLVLEDWAGGLNFDHEEIDKERGVVISEWRTYLSPDQRMQKIYFPIMYQGSRYATRLPIGNPEIVQNADYETVKKFYKDWYRPDLMAVVVVGDFDVDQMEMKIKEGFSSLTNPKSERKRESYNVPGHKETLVSVCSDKEAAFTTVQMMYKHPHVETTNLNDLRQRYINSLYSEMINNRLDELANSPNPPFTFAYLGYDADVGDIDTYSAYAMVPEGGAERGLEVLLEENERVLRHGFTATELERAKTALLKRAERAVKEKDKTESRWLVMRYVYNFLDNNPIPSPDFRLDFVKKVLPGISLEEINQMAKKWITDENRVIVITGPDKEGAPMPDKAKVLAMLEAVKQKDIQPYKDDVSEEPLFSGKLTPAAIISTKEDAELGITELELANGVKVFLKQTDFKNDEIQLTAISEGGSSLYDDELYTQAHYAARVIGQSGIGKLNQTQMDKKLTGKKVRVSPYIGDQTEGFFGNASPDDAEVMMQLIYLYFTAPRKDADALKSFVGQEKGIYQNLMQNPQYFFMNETQKIKFNNHPRVGFPTGEELDALDLDKIYQIFTDRFEDASDFTFFFVGNFEMESFTNLIQTYLGNLPSKARRETWVDRQVKYVDGLVEKYLNKGEAPKTYVNITFHGKDKWNGKNRYLLQSLGDVLRIKLRESLREDKGGVYGVRVRQNFSKFPEPEYYINISFNCDPANEQELIDAVMVEIDKLQKAGAEEKDMTKIKETQRQSRIKDLKENRYWLYGMKNAFRYGDDLNGLTLEALEEQINSLSPEDIKIAANQFIDKNNMIKIVMRPGEKEEN